MTSAAIAIVVYSIVVFVFGALVGRGRRAEDFLIGARQIGLWQSTTSILAVAGGVNLLTTVALAYEKGLGAMWIWIGTSAGLLILAVIARRIKAASDKGVYLTMADFVAEKVDHKSGVLCALLLFVCMFGAVGGEFVAAGSLFSSFTGIGFTPSVLIVCAGALCYLLMAGYRAVVRTDIIQFSIMFGVLLWVLLSVDLGTYKPEQLDLGSLGGLSILTMLILASASTATAAEFWERVYAAKSTRVARQSLVMAAIIFMIFGSGLVILGMAARFHYPNIDANRALYYGLFELAPPALRGLCVLMILAAVQSTIDTELFYMATSLCNDLHRKRTISPELLRTRIRIAIVALGVSAALTAIVVKDLLTLVFTIAGLLSAISPVVLCALFWRVKRQAAFISMLGGAISLGVVALLGKFNVDTAAITFPTALVLLIIGQLVFKK